MSDASGQMKLEEVGGAPLRKDQLDTKDSFILDTAQQIFVWVGKKSTKEEKNKAWDVANVRRGNPGARAVAHPDILSRPRAMWTGRDRPSSRRRTTPSRRP